MVIEVKKDLEVGSHHALHFSYGTLQQEAVQMATFGRPLEGQPDELIGFAQSMLKIEDAQFVATSDRPTIPS
jgi:hypothetical protein